MTHSPRLHHTRFAFDAMPRFGLAGNPKALDILATPMGQPLLLDLWDKVGADLPKADKLPPDGLQATAQMLADARIITITLPTPRADGEVYLVAFASTPEKRKLLLLKQPAMLRCFCVEATPGAQARLVELTRDGARTERAPCAPNTNGLIEALRPLL
jgi:hypothetical protein